MVSEKIKIGYNNHAEQTYNNTKEAKIKAFDELLNHIKEYVKTSEINFNTSDLNAEIKSKILATYKDQFPKMVTSDKILDLIGFQESKFLALIERFQNIDIEFNTKTKECPIIDFNIYAENEIQEQAFKQYNTLAENFNLNIDKIEPGSVIRHQICHAFSNIVYYNQFEHRFEPNINYILKLK